MEIEFRTSLLIHVRVKHVLAGRRRHKRANELGKVHFRCSFEASSVTRTIFKKTDPTSKAFLIFFFLFFCRSHCSIANLIIFTKCPRLRSQWHSKKKLKGKNKPDKLGLFGCQTWTHCLPLIQLSRGSNGQGPTRLLWRSFHAVSGQNLSEKYFPKNIHVAFFYLAKNGWF